MPFDMRGKTDMCLNCPYGYCVSYIGNQNFRDRETTYRISQDNLLTCMFDDGLPDDPSHNSYGFSLSSILDMAIHNVRLAGIELESSGHFTKTLLDGEEVREGFSLTKQQIGKVRGDIYEVILSVLVWNALYDLSNSPSDYLKTINLELNVLGELPIYGLISLGDNYSFLKLMDERSSDKLTLFLNKLTESDTHLTFSTPDLMLIDLSQVDIEIRNYFNCKIIDLSKTRGRLKLREAVRLIESVKVSAHSITHAIGVKTSIKSDRVLQLLYEANAIKFIWHTAFDSSQINYYAIGLSRDGVDITRFNSVSFSTPLGRDAKYSRAIDGSGLVEDLDDIRKWLLVTLKIFSEDAVGYSNTAIKKQKAANRIRQEEGTKAPLFQK